MRAGIIVLRDRETVDVGDGGPVVAVPALPGAWARSVQGRSGWAMLTRPAGQRLWWYTALDGPDVGAPSKILGFAFTLLPAHNAALREWALTHDDAWTLPEMRADTSARAVAAKAAWRMYAHDSAGDPAGPPIMTQRIAGYDYVADAENYATIGAIPDAA